MSNYYNQGAPPGYAGQPPAPYGIAPPLQPQPGYAVGAAGAYPAAAYAQQPAAYGYAAPGYGYATPQQLAAGLGLGLAAGYPAAAYAAQQQPLAAGYYAQQQPFAAQAQAGYPSQAYLAQGAYAQQQQQLPPPAGGYAGPQYSHAIVPGVQTDAFGLPIVPGDVTLQYAQTFRLEEKVLSATHDSFVVRDQQGALRYKVVGSFTINERKTIRDIHGQTLLKLKEARLRMRDRITIFSPTNVPVMLLQKTSAIQIGTKRVHGYIGAHPKGSPDLVIIGNHNNTHFRIVNAQNTEIGVVRRKKYSLKNMLTDQDTYEVTVQAGSPALVCFIAVVLDEIYED